VLLSDLGGAMKLGKLDSIMHGFPAPDQPETIDRSRHSGENHAHDLRATCQPQTAFALSGFR
jgi:hypothetical protein